ncbi:MAG TPA: four helix bundle protein, partial [Dehalococcoidia bacterium]|nr:four helix bundle protein [Dehalococcoidia bacterium]
RTKNLEPEPTRASAMTADYNFRNLVLWQRAQDLSLAVIRLTAALPRDRAADVIARQLIRSASSIAANIAEGHGRFYRAAHRNHLSIAKGSACETDGWLDLLRRAGYIDAATETRLHEMCIEIIRMVTAKILKLEREAEDGHRVSEGGTSYEAADCE